MFSLNKEYDPEKAFIEEYGINYPSQRQEDIADAFFNFEGINLNDEEKQGGQCVEK